MEQTETPEVMAKRISGRSGADKVVRREICQIITPGTWFPSLRNGLSSDTNAFDGLTETSTSQSAGKAKVEIDLSFNRHLLVVLEGPMGTKPQSQLGIAILKGATGEIMLSPILLD